MNHLVVASTDQCAARKLQRRPSATEEEAAKFSRRFLKKDTALGLYGFRKSITTSDGRTIQQDISTPAEADMMRFKCDTCHKRFKRSQDIGSHKAKSKAV